MLHTTNNTIGKNCNKDEITIHNIGLYWILIMMPDTNTWPNIQC